MPRLAARSSQSKGQGVWARGVEAGSCDLRIWISEVEVFRALQPNVIGNVTQIDYTGLKWSNVNKFRFQNHMYFMHLPLPYVMPYYVLFSHILTGLLCAELLRSLKCSYYLLEWNNDQHNHWRAWSHLITWSLINLLGHGNIIWVIIALGHHWFR